jgi:hypothetical protein
MNKKRKGIRLRKLYSLEEDVMAGASLHGLEPVRLSQRLLPYALAGSVEPKGVESDWREAAVPLATYEVQPHMFAK